MTQTSIPVRIEYRRTQVPLGQTRVMPDRSRIASEVPPKGAPN